MSEGWMSFLDTPILQYSITPGSRHSLNLLNLEKETWAEALSSTILTS